jgi:putative tryptophan/tyrosine transport system substrate-binding protein
VRILELLASSHAGSTKATPTRTTMTWWSLFGPGLSYDDVGRAFETAIGNRVDALLVAFDGLFQANPRMITELAVRNRLPAIYVGREFIAAGGLITYGVNFPHLYFRAATYADKIFKGAKPADLPIEQPTKFELVINLKTARSLGLDVPPTLLARADEVIE